MIKNFLQNTLDSLKEFDYGPNDVDYITDGKNCCSWDDFSVMADRTLYEKNRVFPAVIITGIVLKDGTWLSWDFNSRWETYCWEHNTRPPRKVGNKLTSIFRYSHLCGDTEDGHFEVNV